MVADRACRATEAGGKYCSNISPVPFSCNIFTLPSYLVKFKNFI